MAAIEIPSPAALPGGGGTGGNILLAYARGDRTPVVSVSTQNLGINGTLNNVLNENINAIFTNFRTLDGTEWFQFLFAAKVNIQKVVYEQSDGSDQGLWHLETLRNSIWTPQAASVQMGLGIQSGAIFGNTYAIDAVNQANCEGVRFRGDVGGITTFPWRNNFRFYVTD